MKRAKNEFRPRRLALAMAAACAPWALAAQPLEQVPLYGNADMTPWATNNVEIGAIYNSKDSYKFGEWTGLRKKGGYFLGNANLGQLDSASAFYWNATAWNLGLPSRQLSGEVGQQGRWGLNANFDQLTRYVSDSVRTPFENPGASEQVLPAGFPGVSSSNFNAANYDRWARPYGLTSERKLWGVGGDYWLIPGLQLIADFNQTQRKGGFLAGDNAAGTGAVNPIDDRTDQFNLGARYSSDQLQAELTWWYSKYKNDVSATGLLGGPGYTYQNFASGSSFRAPVAVSLAPENEFNQVSGTVAYSLAPAYQVVGTVSHSWGKQNSPYIAPGTTYPNLGTSGTGPTLTSFDGKTAQTLVDLSFTARPLSDLGLRANYRYDDRQNDSPQNRYTAASNRYNLVPDYKDNRFLIEADYRLMRLTKLRGWYEYKKQEYDPVVQFLRADTTNNQFGAEFSSRLSPLVSGSLKYVWDKRDGADYTAQTLNADGTYPPTTAGGQAVQYNDAPNLRQYWVSNYDQNTVKGTINLTPMEILAFQFVADWRKRDYKGPSCGTSAYDLAISPTVAPVCVGLNQSDRTGFTLDGQFMPMEAVSLYAFYSWAELKQNQTGSTATSGAANTLWFTDYKSKDGTIGLGASYKPVSLPLSGGIQYLWTKGTESWGQAQASGAAITPFPDNDYKQQSIQLWAGWRFNKDVTFKANYWWQKLDSTNWSTSYVQPWTVGGTLWLAGTQAPNYNTNVFALSVNIRTW